MGKKGRPEVKNKACIPIAMQLMVQPESCASASKPQQSSSGSLCGHGPLHAHNCLPTNVVVTSQAESLGWSPLSGTVLLKSCRHNLKQDPLVLTSVLAPLTGPVQQTCTCSSWGKSSAPHSPQELLKGPPRNPTDGRPLPTGLQ